MRRSDTGLPFISWLLPLLTAGAGGQDGAGDDPIAFGKRRLAEADAGAAEIVQVAVSGDGAAGSFTIAPGGRGARVTASDTTGAMYGLLELAERVRATGVRALGTTEVRATPFLRDRGLNVFLTLPWNYTTNDTDYDPAALTDPQRWWFQNEDYWRTLLDQMADSRLNWLDVHGTWDVSVTDAPNLWAYFLQSEKYPEVGVDPDIKAKNLAQLNHVIELAHARGVRVSLMCYEARLSTPHRRNPPYPNDEATAYDYTREMVEKAIRQAPGLDAIGFRIGESGRGGEFFRCYLEAVAKSGRDIPLVTRSWVTRKEKVVPLARGSSDFTVEIKYNGEQWGTPWPIAGGRMANWKSYSFEDYLSDSGAGDAKRFWPGNATSEGGRFPDQPYKIVWQVRANGTHRIFPFYEPDHVRRSIVPMRMGTASGYTVEPLNAYYPASPRYYVADPAELPCDWIHQRDELWLMLWGRLGYDPETPDAVFEQRLQERFGGVAPALSRAWRAASRVIPTAFMARAFGPDHRDHAPELEWGGSTRELIEGEGLDTHVVRPIREEIALQSTGGSDGRVSVLDVASDLEQSAEAAEAELVALNNALDKAALDKAAVDQARDVPALARFRELRNAIALLASLGRYHAGRLRAAWWTAQAEAVPSTPDARLHASEQMNRALRAWMFLTGSMNEHARFYRPFTERLRMRTNSFSWSSQLRAVQGEAAQLAALIPAAHAPPDPKSTFDAGTPARPAPPLPSLRWSDDGGAIVATLPAHGVDRAWLLAKPLPSSTFFHKLPMEKRGAVFEARFPRERWGHVLAAEVRRGDVTRRLPDWREATPWIVVPAGAGPTPLIYSVEEALAHLDPAVLSREKQGLLVVAPRAWDFFRRFDVPTQRKLLEAVERGMTLLVLQQDYTSGRYPLSWLPEPPQVENVKSDLFDPAGVLKLEVARAPDLLWQRFVAGRGWRVAGNGGLATRRFGRGDVVLVQARLIQNLHHPECARALLTLLKLGGTERPVVLVDPGTEGARYSTSLLPDFLNAHDLPFLTLGEVVAREQGPGTVPARSGRLWDDLLLGGRGGAMLQGVLDQQAKAAAARPLPTSREAFEAQRAAQKRRVMQCLGLDPLPPRTPLEPRITGTIERDGYRVEKLVLDSRPGFPVTAHLYVPADATGKLPVIVNPHGHWQHKKMEPVVQQRLIQQALHGYLVLAVDSPGFSFEGEALIERRYAGSHVDFRNTLGSANTTAIYVWDMMRALDYLETRPEADMTRIGITGASGGGLATLWGFIADERFTCAVPVCFATSLEIEPHNGCPCNHVPGTLRLGDRSDALAVRAPAPVFVIGADDDREFPPEGTRRTGEKLKELYGLFGAADAARWQVFRSQHDYNLEMVAAALGFFDQHLKGVGDGAPVPLTARPTEPAESREMLCLPEVPDGRTTMRDVAVARMATVRAGAGAADLAQFVAQNGGTSGATLGGIAAPPSDRTRSFAATDERGKTVALPATRAEVGKAESARGGAGGAVRCYVTFESESGLQVPGILRLPAGPPRGGVIYVNDAGKAATGRFDSDKLVAGGFACLALDPRGFGELAPIDLGLLIYHDTAPSFAAALDVVRAVALLEPLCGRVALVTDGPAAGQVALAAAALAPKLGCLVARDAMREFTDAFREEIPLLALQPQADLLPPLPALRAALPMPARWSFAGDADSDLFATLLRLMKL